MTSETGAMKNIPPGAQVYLLLTHVTPEKLPAAQALARFGLRSPRLAHIFCSSQPGEWRDILKL